MEDSATVYQSNNKIKRDTNWIIVLFFLHVHVLGLLGLYYVFFEASFLTIFYTFFLTVLGVLGATAGSHKLWAHQSYKADRSLKIFLMICHTIAGWGTIYNWVVKHRLHHKYFNTDLDPYNPSKGFINSHILSLTKLSSETDKELEKEIDVSDLENDGVVMFQKKYYPLLYFLICVLLPINAPCEYWGESILTSFLVAGWLRYAVTLHATFLIHSGTKVWGIGPGERYPCDTNMVFFVNKSYWTQYHYLAPFDYLTGEYGDYDNGWTTKFIKICEALELAHDLRTMSSDDIKSAVYRSVHDKIPLKDCIEETERRLRTIDAS